MRLDAQIQALARGDFSGFEDIYRQTNKSVYYIALSIVKEKMLAEDVMQATYMKVIQNAANFRFDASVTTWIATIARNTALNVYRQNKKDVNVDTIYDTAQLGMTHTDEYGFMIDMARNLLPEDEFTILMLVTAQGYKRRDVAKIMNMPIGTVTWKYKKALNTLKQALEENE